LKKILEEWGFEMKLIKFSILMMVLGLFGCDFSPLQAPSIKSQSTHFEHQYFSIDYPSNWIVVNEPPYKFEVPGDLVRMVTQGQERVFVTFKDPHYKKYAVWVLLQRMSEDQKKQFAQNRDFSSVGRHFKSVLKEEGFENFSSKQGAISYVGMPATKIITAGSKNSETKEYHSILMEVGDMDIQVNYFMWSDFTEDVKKRIDSIVNSLYVK